MNNQNNIFHTKIYSYNNLLSLLIADGQFLLNWKGYDDQRVDEDGFVDEEDIEPSQILEMDPACDVVSYKENEFWLIGWYQSEKISDLDEEENKKELAEFMEKLVELLKEHEAISEEELGKTKAVPIKGGTLGLLCHGDSGETFGLSQEKINELAGKKGVHELEGKNAGEIRGMQMIGGLEGKSYKLCSYLNEEEISNELGVIVTISLLKIE